MKQIFNQAKHPTFIGSHMQAICARNGGAFMFYVESAPIACALVNPRLNVLLAMAVIPSHQKHGLGSAILKYLQCNFARVETRAISFFERNGFISIGKLKKGRSLMTQIMVRDSLRKLAGRVNAIYGSQQ